MKGGQMHHSTMTSISECNREERQWLFMAVWRVFVQQCKSTPEEQKFLIRQLTWVRQADMGKLMDLASFLGKDFPLRPPESVDLNKAKIMWVELMRRTVQDGMLSASKMRLIILIGKILGFEREAMEPAMELAKKMAELEQIATKLTGEMASNYKRRKTDQVTQPSLKLAASAVSAET